MIKKLVLGFFCFTAPVVPVALLVLYLWDILNSVQVMSLLFVLMVVYSVFTGPIIKEFYNSKKISEDEKVFWTTVPEIIAWPVVYFKIVYAGHSEPLAISHSEVSQKPVPLFAQRLAGFFCYAIPFYLLTKLFGLGAYWQMLGAGQHWLKYFAIGGFFYVLFAFWRSRRFTTDDKLFWTVAIMFSMGLGLPLLYVKKVRNAEAPEGTRV